MLASAPSKLTRRHRLLRRRPRKCSYPSLVRRICRHTCLQWTHWVARLACVRQGQQLATPGPAASLAVPLRHLQHFPRCPPARQLKHPPLLASPEPRQSKGWRSSGLFMVPARMQAQALQPRDTPNTLLSKCQTCPPPVLQQVKATLRRKGLMRHLLELRQRLHGGSQSRGLDPWRISNGDVAVVLAVCACFLDHDRHCYGCCGCCGAQASPLPGPVPALTFLPSCFVVRFLQSSSSFVSQQHQFVLNARHRL